MFRLPTVDPNPAHAHLPWEGGKPEGFVSELTDQDGKIYAYLLTYKDARSRRTRRFHSYLSSYDGDATEAKRVAEHHLAVQTRESGILKNRYRRIGDDTIEVHLGGRHLMVTDVRFLNLVAQYDWVAKLEKYDGDEHRQMHVASDVGDGFFIHFDTLITGWDQVVHLNADPLDCRLANLRPRDP